ncbi:MAG: ABC transporter permease [Pseudomonadota bacterium]
MIRYYQTIRRYRRIIWAMALRQIAERNAGTLGGFAWEIIHPLSMVMIYWVVFAVGFKAKGPGDTPYILYFITGMLPWVTFASVFNGSTQGVVANAHLVRKTIFPTEVIPVVYLSAALIPHIILLVIVLVVMLLCHWHISWAILQIPYYFGGMSALLLGLSWISSALNVYNRDIGQLIRVLTEIWFWMTPVVWSLDLVPARLQWLFRLNPMCFVIDGYRDSLLLGRGFWHGGWSAICFWPVTAMVLVVGAYVFRRLKPMFADEI